MGKEDVGKDHHPPHTVTISKGFWIGKFEISQKQYADVTGTNPCEGSRWGEGDFLPVYNVNWYDAVRFCNLLSERCGLKPYYIIGNDNSDSDNISPNDSLKRKVKTDDAANGFRLPTETQWEFACRAGTQTDFYWGKDSSWEVSGKYAWHMFNSGQRMYSKGRFWWVKYHKVKKTGSKHPNKFGIYDMCGNVAEWCFDRYDKNYYKTGEKKDPVGTDGEFIYRVARGGSVLDSPKDMTSWKRWPFEPFEKTGTNGIRVVLPE
jgi:formylglycine-generating enzyme required for sulfatase activity